MTKTAPPLSEYARTLHPGIYRHYKGSKYEVLSVAMHSETLEELVVYRALENPNRLWVRPLSMFLENITLDSGIAVPRFAFIGSS